MRFVVCICINFEVQKCNISCFLYLHLDDIHCDNDGHGLPDDHNHDDDDDGHHLHHDDDDQAVY